MYALRRQLAHTWTQLRASFWFVPGLMVAASVALAAGSLAVDAGLTDATLPGWVYGGGAEGARGLLSTVAGSMVTVAGVGFSITIVALVLASTQFGPRLLTLFMRDIVSQVTLGIFTGTFTYCILTLRTIRGAEEGADAFVPNLSVSIAIVLTLISVAALLYFFHHVAVSIQAPKVVATVARDLDRAIDSLSNASAGRHGPMPDASEIPDPRIDALVAATSTGYVQVLDDAAVLALAQSRSSGPHPDAARPVRARRQSRLRDTASGLAQQRHRRAATSGRDHR